MSNPSNAVSSLSTTISDFVEGASKAVSNNSELIKKVTGVVLIALGALVLALTAAAALSTGFAGALPFIAIPLAIGIPLGLGLIGGGIALIACSGNDLLPNTRVFKEGYEAILGQGALNGITNEQVVMLNAFLAVPANEQIMFDLIGNAWAARRTNVEQLRAFNIIGQACYSTGFNLLLPHAINALRLESSVENKYTHYINALAKNIMGGACVQNMQPCTDGFYYGIHQNVIDLEDPTLFNRWIGGSAQADGDGYQPAGFEGVKFKSGWKGSGGQIEAYILDDCFKSGVKTIGMKWSNGETRGVNVDLDLSILGHMDYQENQMTMRFINQMGVILCDSHNGQGATVWLQSNYKNESAELDQAIHGDLIDLLDRITNDSDRQKQIVHIAAEFQHEMCRQYGLAMLRANAFE